MFETLTTTLKLLHRKTTVHNLYTCRTMYNDSYLLVHVHRNINFYNDLFYFWAGNTIGFKKKKLIRATSIRYNFSFKKNIEIFFFRHF